MSDSIMKRTRCWFVGKLVTPRPVVPEQPPVNLYGL
jgi:hypothetical protein